MFGLPQSTDIEIPFTTDELYEQFAWEKSQRTCLNASVLRFVVVNRIAPTELPDITKGKTVKAIFVVKVALKSRNFDPNILVLLANSIPQHIVYVVCYEDEAMLAVYHSKLFTAKWQAEDEVRIPLVGSDLDTIWQNIVTSIGNFEVAKGNTLDEQIRIDEGNTDILHQMELIERKMRKTTQRSRQRELYAELKKLKSLL